MPRGYTLWALILTWRCRGQGHGSLALQQWQIQEEGSKRKINFQQQCAICARCFATVTVSPSDEALLNVGGRNRGERPQGNAKDTDYKPLPEKRRDAPPVGSDMANPEPPPQDDLTEEDLKLIELAQKLQRQQNELETFERVLDDTQSDNGEYPEVNTQNVQSVEPSSQEDLVLGDSDNEVKVNGEVNISPQEKQMTEDGQKTCMDCEAEVNSVEAEAAEPELVTSPPADAPAPLAQEGEDAASSAAADGTEAEASDGDTEKDAAAGEGLSTVDLPEVAAGQGLEFPTGTDTQGAAGDGVLDTQVEHVRDDITAPTQDSDMPSFDEWKRRMLAQQAQQEKSKQLEAQSTHSSSNTGSKKSKGRNYASLSCGAKVLATNPEAQNTGSVLTENKDSYIIQPCKAKKWFVVQLCEPVQVTSLEIANLELFSSLPEKFVVNISDRYPSKEWRALGTFHARDERAIQSFTVANVDIYAKYLRVEMVSHYGREHYCPLTILRVFGTTVEDDDDVEAADASNDESSEDADNDKPSNLFEAATGTVLSLVKTVLSPGEKEAQDEASTMDEVIALNGTLVNGSVPNTTQPVVDEDAKPAGPCPPDARVEHDEDKPSSVETLPSTKPEVPDATIIVGEVPDRERGDKGLYAPEAQTAPPGDKAGDSPTSQQPEELQHEGRKWVTLIESPVSLKSILDKCDYCEKPGKIEVCKFDTSTTCGYKKLLKFIYPTCCYQMGKVVVDDQVPAKPIDPVTKDVSSPKDRLTISPPPRTMVNGHSTSEDFKPTMTESITATIDATQSDSYFTVDGSSETVQASTITPAMTVMPSEVDSSPICDSSGEATEGLCSTMGPDVVQIRPTSLPEDSESLSVAPPTQEPHLEEQGQGQNEGQGDGQIPQGQQASAIPRQPDEVKMPIIDYSEQVIHPEDHVEEVEPPMGEVEEQEHVRYSSEKKQTTFMKLKNRIKTLELNLNLSSRYLEELSQRYRRQMEEMYVSLNRTIMKLTNTSKSAEARDLKQQEHISQLQKRIANLTGQVSHLTDSIANIHAEVIERHLFLMMIEMTVFAVLFIWCIQRHARPVYITQSPQQATPAKIETNIKEISSSKVTPKKQIARRNSIGSTTPSAKAVVEELSPKRSLDDIELRWSGSEGTFGIVDPSSNVFINPDPQDKELDWQMPVTKKKKKKHKGRNSLGIMQAVSSSELYNKQLSQPSSMDSCHSRDSSSSRDSQGSSSFLSRAGLLFASHSDKGTNAEKYDKGRDKKKAYKGRKSLDLQPSYKNTSTDSSGRFHTKSSPNGTVVSPSNGMQHQHSVSNIGRTDTTNGNGTMAQANGSAGFLVCETSWKNYFPGIRK